MWPALELVLRAIFCNPKPTTETDRALMSPGEARIYKTLGWIGHLTAFCELINFLFDFVIVIKLAQDGQNSAALALAGGMVLAWLVSYLGHVRLVGPNKGVLWAPLFQSPLHYYKDIPKLERPMRVVYCLVFTEMAAFFFEDAIFVSSFLREGTLVKTPDDFEQFNLVWTFCRAVIAGSVMILAMLLGSNAKCLTCRKTDKHEQEDSSSSSSRLCSTVLKAFVFLAIWAWLATVWIVTMSDIKFIFAENIIDNATSKIPVSLWGDIAIYWSGGLYFASPLLFGQRGAGQSDDNGNGASTSSTPRHSSMNSKECFTPRTVDSRDSFSPRSSTMDGNKDSFHDNELQEDDDDYVGGVEV